MAKNNIMLGFDGLTKKQAAALMSTAEDLGVDSDKSTMGKNDGDAVDSKSDKSDGKKRGPGRPPGEIILPRAVGNAAKAYAEEFGADAKKTVLNHFGATTVTGANGLQQSDYAEVIAIFKSGEEFQPGGTPDTGKKKDKKDKADSDDTGKKKDKKDKKKKKDK